MARIEVEGGNLVLRLSVLEKVMSFGGNRRVPIALLRNIVEVPHAGTTAKDTPTFIPLHRFGTMMPGVIIYGSIMTVTGWDFLAVVGNRPGVCFDFAEGSPFSRLIVSVRDPKATIALIRDALPPHP